MRKIDFTLCLTLLIIIPFNSIAQNQAVMIFDNPTDSAGDLTGQTDFDPADSRNLTIAWDVPQNNARDWHVYVKAGLGGYKFLGRTGTGDADRLNWYPEAPNLAATFLNGPNFNTVYSFRVVRLDDQIGSGDIFDTAGPAGFNIEGGNSLTLSLPEQPNLNMRQISILDDLLGGNNLAPFGSTGADIDAPDSRAIQIAWNFGGDSTMIKDYHIQVSMGGGAYQFLGQTLHGALNYFWWTPNSHFKTSASFTKGPQNGKQYRFRVVQIPFSGEIDTLTSGILTYSVQDAQIPTPTPTGTMPVPTTTPTPTPQQETPGESITIDIPNLPTESIPLEMVFIPSGSFTMGSPEDEAGRNPDEGPQHQVTLTNSFYMSKYEITQSQWQTVMGNNPAAIRGNNQPVEKVSWFDCIQFCNTLSTLMGKAPVYDESGDNFNLDTEGFRLPTEAEWEYACRATTTTRYYWGDDPDNSEIGEYAWYEENSNLTTHIPGMKLPNLWDLFDINGNVWEWCSDWYGPYSANTQTNPTGPQSGTQRSVRGGGWYAEPVELRSAHRERLEPEETFGNLGLRIVLPENTQG